MNLYLAVLAVVIFLWWDDARRKKEKERPRWFDLSFGLNREELYKNPAWPEKAQEYLINGKHHVNSALDGLAGVRYLISRDGLIWDVKNKNWIISDRLYSARLFGGEVDRFFLGEKAADNPLLSLIIEHGNLVAKLTYKFDKYDDCSVLGKHEHPECGPGVSYKFCDAILATFPLCLLELDIKAFGVKKKFLQLLKEHNLECDPGDYFTTYGNIHFSADIRGIYPRNFLQDHAEAMFVAKALGKK